MTSTVKTVLSFLLITAAAYALSTLFLSSLNRELLRDLPSPAPPKSTVETRTTPAQRPIDSAKPMEKTSAAALQNREKPGLTSLHLKLLGTAVNDKGSSWAVIHDLDRDRQEMVGVGSVVAGAKVVSIGKDRVLLQVDGREEILLLGAEGTRLASSRPDQETQESAASTAVLSREVVRESLENLPALMSTARAELYVREGKSEGFQLSRIQQGSLLESVGFQDGDVIQSVNGRGVRSIQDAIEIYQKFGDRDSFTIGILRGDRPRTLHVKIK